MPDFMPDFGSLEGYLMIDSFILGRNNGGWEEQKTYATQGKVIIALVQTRR